VRRPYMAPVRQKWEVRGRNLVSMPSTDTRIGQAVYRQDDEPEDVVVDRKRRPPKSRRASLKMVESSHTRP